MKRIAVSVVVFWAILTLAGTGMQAAQAKSQADTAPKYIKAAFLLGSMQADILEGVEEAFAYLLLNDASEKADFEKKMKHFEQTAIKFKMTVDLSTPEQKVLYKDFEKVLAAKSQMQVTAEAMFKGFEKDGKVNMKLVEEFEVAVDQLTETFDMFLETAINEDVRKQLASSTQGQAAILLVAMHGDILEAIEEAFAYPLLGEPAEKQDFFKKVRDFDHLALEFKYRLDLARSGSMATAKLFYRMMAAKAMLEEAAINLFTEFDAKAKVSKDTLHAFEKAVDGLTEAYDKLVAEYAKGLL